MSGMTYNPITQRYRLEPTDVGVNYLAAFRRAG
jgi:2-polyprenyl-3-methyl-5-hydroxy-6-metoxy-1,4-benzoquinol methylase